MTRMRRAPVCNSVSSRASGTPAAMEISKWFSVKCPRISASTPATWSGLTARMTTSAVFTTVTFEVVVLAPTVLANEARAASRGSLAMTSLAATSPD